jgi:hypothetical protein
MRIRSQVIALCLIAGAASAQPSTDRALHPLRRPTIELSAGMELPFRIRKSFATTSGGSVAALMGAARFHISEEPSVSLRVAPMWIRRRATGSSNSGGARIDHVFSVAVSTDVVVTRIGSVEIGPSLGYGLAGVQTNSPAHPAGSRDGTVWSAGLALRSKRVVIEQHWIGVLGGTVVDQREYFPLTVGIRF